MKKNLKFLLLTPCLMSILCEDSSDDCSSVTPQISYTLNVENTSEIYLENEVIVLSAETASMPCLLIHQVITSLLMLTVTILRSSMRIILKCSKITIM